MRYKVQELEGAMLDAAVAKAEGLPYVIDSTEDDLKGTSSEWVMAARPGFQGKEDLGRRRVDRKEYSPSTSWDQGGPIIYRERIAISPPECDCCEKYNQWTAELLSADISAEGATPLIAAMRAYVASKFGEKVDL